MSDTTDRMISRQWQIVSYLLQQTHYISASQIQDYLKTQGVNAEMRTVQRDLKTLQKVLPLECRTDDKPYGWRWRQLDNVKSHGLSIKQAVLFKLIESELSDLIPADMMEKLHPILMKSNFLLANAATPPAKPTSRIRGGGDGISGMVPINPIDRAWLEIHSLFGSFNITTYFKRSPIQLSKEDKVTLRQLLGVLNSLHLNNVAREMKKIIKI